VKNYNRKICKFYLQKNMNQISILDLLKEIDQPEATKEGYLGPKSEFIGYSAYIKSYSWKKKRLLAIEKLGRKCQKCGKESLPLDVHHKHYQTLYHERLVDVEILCSLCHQIEDKKRSLDRQEKAYSNGFMTWASKKYGEECWLYMDEIKLTEEFDEWLELKQNDRM
jgi:hypothetical protein